jgi:hypothetical protein
MRATKQYSKGILAIVVLSSMAILTAINSNAQTITTDPVGYITLPITSNGYTYVALGMTRLAVARGVIGQIGANSLTDLNQTFAPGTGTNYFIEITSGSAIGIMDDITNTAAGPYYTAFTNYYSMISSGATYKVYPHWTPDTALGTPAQSGLIGGSTVSVADNVIVFNPNTQGSATYWYKNTGSSASQGWKFGAAAAGTNVLYLDQGLVIQHRTNTLPTLLLVGGVKLGPTISPCNTNYTYAANVYAGGWTFDNSGLYTTNALTGVNGGSTVSVADNVMIFNPNTQGSATYWYKNTGSAASQGWKLGAGAAGTTNIPYGTVLVIKRRYNATFNWTMPVPY